VAGAEAGGAEVAVERGRGERDRAGEKRDQAAVEEHADGLGGPDHQRRVGLGAVEEAGQRVDQAAGEGDDVADGVEEQEEDECGAGSGHGRMLARGEATSIRPPKDPAQP
jgi:hypothetical protein